MLAALVLATVTSQLSAVVVSSTTVTTDILKSSPIAGLVAFLGAGLLGALALAQLLATASFEEARRIDFRGNDTQRPPLPSLSSDSWTGRR